MIRKYNNNLREVEIDGESDELNISQKYKI